MVWLLGLALAQTLGVWAAPWLHLKLALVLALTAFHGLMVARSKQMARGERPLREKQLRIWGEVPGILLALIVVLVVVGPALFSAN